MKFITIGLMVAVATSVTVQSKSLETFIIHGTNTTETIGFYAYLEIFSQADFGGPTMYFGGGTVISTSFILTCAQNVARFKSWRIGLGANRISNMQWFLSTTAFIHHGYDDQTLVDNIALLRLTQHIFSYADITPINLPSDNITSISGGVYVYGFGFGTTNQQPDVLQRIILSATTHQECGARYPHLDQAGHTLNHLCAEHFVGNICAGDQGGPAVVGSTLFGIQSFYRNDKCGSPEAQPAAFIFVPRYVNWISNVTNTQPL